MELALKIVLSYLLGSISGSLLLGRLKGGVDIRTAGSGNAGGTNALRTQGFKFALGVVAIDIGKGALAAGFIAAAGGGWEQATLYCAAAAVFGHCYPLWHGFRGGKGAATFVGALTVISWQLVGVLLLIWLVVVLLSGYVGLATIVSSIAVPLFYWLHAKPALPNALPVLISLAVFIVFTHRSNIQRMLSGNENRNLRLWLLKPRA